MQQESLYCLDFPRAPALVEERLQWAVEAQDDKLTLAGLVFFHLSLQFFDAVCIPPSHSYPRQSEHQEHERAGGLGKGYLPFIPASSCSITWSMEKVAGRWRGGNAL